MPASAAQERSGAPRSRPCSMVVSLAPNETTILASASGNKRGSASSCQRPATCSEVSRLTPRLYPVNGSPFSNDAATTRPTQPLAVGSPTPTMRESPKNSSRRSFTAVCPFARRKLDAIIERDGHREVASPIADMLQIRDQVRVFGAEVGDDHRK